MRESIKELRSIQDRRQDATRLEEATTHVTRIPGSREELELKVAEATKKVSSLSKTLAKKEAEMAGMEEHFKKYIEKAKSVIKTLDPKQNPSGGPEVSALKNQRQDKNQTLINSRRSAHYYQEEAERERSRLAQELLEVRAGKETLISDLKNALQQKESDLETVKEKFSECSSS